MNRPAITPELRQWIVDQARAGCTPESVLQAMRNSGWPEDTAVEAMESVLRAHLGAPAPAEVLGIGPGSSVPEPNLREQAAWLDAGDRRVAVLSALARPRVIVFGGLLSDAECDALVQQARPRLARSETVRHDDGGSEVNAARTSQGMFFERGESAVVKRVEARIGRLLNWPVDHGEGLQVLHYRPGAEYRPHHDYFDPAQPGTAAVLKRGGQRVGTLVMYLNTPERGGATTFPEVGLEVAPIKGNAVFFSYDRPDPATLTLHAGAPVLAGEKWVATKWLRQGVFT